MTTVFVGLSGGVDSAVSAALLQERGYRVIGCFIKIWQPEFIECSWREDRLDAMRVCASLRIPYREVDLSEDYKHHVVNDMVRDYEQGVTPNPDVLCNTKIKFGVFAKWAFANGADMIATGHYARVEKHGDVYALLRGVDPAKDQSYFLWQLTQEQLSRTLFPVGRLTKQHVRVLAEKFDLPVAKKQDSQGLCFVGDITLHAFLSHYISLRPGVVLNDMGEPIGTHEGAILYTRGQRHGFTHSGSANSSLFVIDTNKDANTITVSTNRNRAACATVFVTDEQVNDENLLRNAYVQVRYRENAEPAFTRATSSGRSVTFKTPRIAAPGQSLVWYDRERLIGGAVIARCV